MRARRAASSLWASLLAACCTMAAVGTGASNAVPMNRETAEKLQARLDTGWPPLLTLIDRWRLKRESYKDFRQRTERDDVSEFVLTREQRADIERRRRAVSRQIDAGDWPGAIFEAIEALGVVRGVGERLVAVQQYWLFAEREALRQRDWAAALAAHGLDDSGAPAKRELELGLRKRVLAGELVAVARDDIPAYEAHWKQTAETARQSAGVDVLQHDPLRRAAKVACGPAGIVMPEATPLEPVRIDTNGSVSTSSFYPMGAAWGGRIGQAAVKVLVAAEGCARWAELAETSGHLALDEAALRYALEGARYRAARLDVKPVAATITFRVKFEINDTEPDSQNTK